MRAGIAMVTLVDDEGIAECAHVDLVGTEKIDQLDLALGGTVEDPGDVTPVLTRDKPEIQPADPRRRLVQDIEAVPVRGDGAEFFRHRARQRHYLGAIGAGQRRLADDNHRPLGRLQHLGEGALAVGELTQHIRAIAQMRRRIGHVVFGADDADLHGRAVVLGRAIGRIQQFHSPPADLPRDVIFGLAPDQIDEIVGGGVAVVVAILIGQRLLA